MWNFLLVIVALLGQNQAAPLSGDSHSFLLNLQPQQAQTTASVVPVFTQQQTSSSSSDSSSSSSDTSESSQSSEGPQQVRERQNLENTAVEQTESSQESAEVPQSPSNGNTSLWLNELVALGRQAEPREQEQEAGDDSMESGRHTTLTFHPLLTNPQSEQTTVSPEDTRSGETTTPGGEVVPVGGVRDKDADREFHQLLDNSMENEDELTFDLLGHHGYHGNEAGLELGL